MPFAARAIEPALEGERELPRKCETPAAGKGDGRKCGRAGAVSYSTASNRSAASRCMLGSTCEYVSSVI